MAEIKFFRNHFGKTVIGTGSVLVDFYTLYGELRVEKVWGSGVFTKTADFSMDPIAGVSNFFVVNSGLRGWFTFQHFNPSHVTSIQKVTDNILRAKFFGGNNSGSVTELGDYVVLKGGVGDEFDPEEALAMINAGRFLTWAPKTKELAPDQPELLHYLVASDAVTTAKLKVTVNYADGTEEIITPLEIAVDQYDLLRIPVGMEALELASIDFTKVITSYSVWLTDQDDEAISEYRHYIPDLYEQPWQRLWMYENSLGMPEVIRTTGKSSRATGVQLSTNQIYLPPSHDIKVASYQTSEARIRVTEEVSTGFLLDLDTAHYMQDFLLQKGAFYELIDGDYKPMQMIPPSTYQIQMDEEYNYFLRFNVRGAFDNHAYRPS